MAVVESVKKGIRRPQLIVSAIILVALIMVGIIVYNITASDSTNVQNPNPSYSTIINFNWNPPRYSGFLVQILQSVVINGAKYNVGTNRTYGGMLIEQGIIYKTVHASDPNHLFNITQFQTAGAYLGGWNLSIVVWNMTKQVSVGNFQYNASLILAQYHFTVPYVSPPSPQMTMPIIADCMDLSPC